MSDNDEQDAAEVLDFNDQITSDTKTRWALTGTILATVILLSLPSLVVTAGLGIVSLSAISQGWFALYSTLVVMAATWVFGEDVLKAVRRARTAERND